MKGMETHTTTCTVVYDSNDNEIDRMDGQVSINPKNYDSQLPITYKQIRTTTELLAVVRIEKENTK